MKEGTLGSVIHGTLRAEDIIPALVEKLEELDDNNNFTNIIANAKRIIGLGQWDWTEEVAEAQDELCRALQDAAPAYCYFGTNEGDGSDFGFWIDYNRIDEEVEDGALLRVRDLADIPKGCKSTVIFVNDHGNISCYEPHWEMRESWSTV